MIPQIFGRSPIEDWSFGNGEASIVDAAARAR